MLRLSQGYSSLPRDFWTENSLVLKSAFTLQWILLALLVLFACSIADAQNCGRYPCTQQSSSQQTPSEPTVIVVPPPQMDTGCTSFPSSTPGESERRAQALDKLGPQLPPLYTMSTFSVMGFSKGNWPVVIDYLLEQDSLVLVVIAPEGQKPQIFRLDGKKGHWQTRIQLPPEIGNDLRVSQYLVQTLDNGVGSVSPSHIHIHGIAAGPQAVGALTTNQTNTTPAATQAAHYQEAQYIRNVAVAQPVNAIGIDQVTFAPASILLAQHQKARYSFHSLFDFKNTEVTFIRLAKSSDGEIIAAAVGQKSMGSIMQNARKNGDWDGSIKPPDVVKSYPPEIQKWLLAPVGQHTLQVRAWYGAKEGGDWVTALAETIVAVE
jgi:hypothetical protein